MKPNPQERGIAILTVILTLFSLMIIGTPFLISMRLQKEASNNQLYRVQAKYSAIAAANHAMAVMAKTLETYEASSSATLPFNSPTIDTDSEFDVTLEELGENYQVSNDGLMLSVQVQDEQGKVNLNSATALLLENVFQQAGLGTSKSQTLAKAVTYFRNQRHPLRSLGELRLCADIDLPDGRRQSVTLDEVEFLRDFCTVHSTRVFEDAVTRHPVNINTAPREVVIALFTGVTARNDQNLMTINASGDGTDIVGTGTVINVTFPSGFAGQTWTLECTDDSANIDGEVGFVFSVKTGSTEYESYRFTRTASSVYRSEGGEISFKIVNGRTTDPPSDPANDTENGTDFATGDRFVISVSESSTALSETKAAKLADRIRVTSKLDADAAEDAGDIQLDSTDSFPAKGWIEVGGDLIRYTENDTGSDTLTLVSGTEEGVSFDHTAGPNVTVSLVLTDWADLDTILSEAETDGDITSAEREAVYMNAVNPQGSLVGRSTTGIAFKSGDIFTLQAAAILNSSEGEELGKFISRRVIQPAQSEESTWEIDNQTSFLELLQQTPQPTLVSHSAPRSVTDFPTAGHDPDGITATSGASVGSDQITVSKIAGFRVGQRIKVSDDEDHEYATIIKVEEQPGSDGGTITLEDPLAQGYGSSAAVSPSGGIALAPSRVHTTSSDVSAQHFDEGTVSDFTSLEADVGSTPATSKPPNAGTINPSTATKNIGIEGLFVGEDDLDGQVGGIGYKADDGNIHTSTDSIGLAVSNGQIEFWFKPLWGTTGLSSDHHLFDMASDEYKNRLSLMIRAKDVVDETTPYLVLRITDGVLRDADPADVDEAHVSEVRVPVTENASADSSKLYLEEGVWHHFRMLWKGTDFGKMALFVDGRMVGTYWPASFIKPTSTPQNPILTAEANIPVLPFGIVLDPLTARSDDYPPEFHSTQATVKIMGSEIVQHAAVTDPNIGIVTINVRGERRTTPRPHYSGEPVTHFGYVYNVNQHRWHNSLVYFPSGHLVRSNPIEYSVLAHKLEMPGAEPSAQLWIANPYDPSNPKITGESGSAGNENFTTAGNLAEKAEYIPFKFSVHRSESGLIEFQSGTDGGTYIRTLMKMNAGGILSTDSSSGDPNPDKSFTVDENGNLDIVVAESNLRGALNTNSTMFAAVGANPTAENDVTPVQSMMLGIKHPAASPTISGKYGYVRLTYDASDSNSIKNETEAGTITFSGGAFTTQILGKNSNATVTTGGSSGGSYGVDGMTVIVDDGSLVFYAEGAGGSENKTQSVWAGFKEPTEGILYSNLILVPTGYRYVCYTIEDTIHETESGKIVFSYDEDLDVRTYVRSERRVNRNGIISTPADSSGGYTLSTLPGTETETGTLGLTSGTESYVGAVNLDASMFITAGPMNSGVNKQSVFIGFKTLENGGFSSSSLISNGPYDYVRFTRDGFGVDDFPSTGFILLSSTKEEQFEGEEDPTDINVTERIFYDRVEFESMSVNLQGGGSQDLKLQRFHVWRGPPGGEAASGETPKGRGNLGTEAQEWEFDPSDSGKIPSIKLISVEIQKDDTYPGNVNYARGYYRPKELDPPQEWLDAGFSAAEWRDGPGSHEPNYGAVVALRDNPFTGAESEVEWIGYTWPTISQVPQQEEEDGDDGDEEETDESYDDDAIRMVSVIEVNPDTSEEQTVETEKHYLAHPSGLTRASYNTTGGWFPGPPYATVEGTVGAKVFPVYFTSSARIGAGDRVTLRDDDGTEVEKIILRISNNGSLFTFAAEDDPNMPELVQGLYEYVKHPRLMKFPTGRNPALPAVSFWLGNSAPIGSDDVKNPANGIYDEVKVRRDGLSTDRLHSVLYYTNNEVPINKRSTGNNPLQRLGNIITPTLEAPFSVRLGNLVRFLDYDSIYYKEGDGDSYQKRWFQTQLGIPTDTKLPPWMWGSHDSGSWPRYGYIKIDDEAFFYQMLYYHPDTNVTAFVDLNESIPEGSASNSLNIKVHSTEGFAESGYAYIAFQVRNPYYQAFADPFMRSATGGSKSEEENPIYIGRRYDGMLTLYDHPYSWPNHGWGYYHPHHSPRYEVIFYEEKDDTTFKKVQRGLMDSVPYPIVGPSSDLFDFSENFPPSTFNDGITPNEANEQPRKSTLAGNSYLHIRPLQGVELQILQRASLGTTAAYHAIGGVTMPLEDIKSVLLTGPLTSNGTLPVVKEALATKNNIASEDKFPKRGMLELSTGEVIGFSSRGQSSFEGVHLLRERYGTDAPESSGEDYLTQLPPVNDMDTNATPNFSPSSTPNSVNGSPYIARLLPYRYFDGMPKKIEKFGDNLLRKTDYGADGAIYLRAGRTVAGATWKELHWEEGNPGNFIIHVAVRIGRDSAPDWSEWDPTNSDVQEELRGKGLFVFTSGDSNVGKAPKGPLYLTKDGEAPDDDDPGFRGDHIELRVFFEYPEEAYSPTDPRKNDWKKTPFLDSLKVKFKTPAKVLHHEELAF